MDLLTADNTQGAPSFELGTFRSAVECSTTELYPHALYFGQVIKSSILWIYQIDAISGKTNDWQML